MAQSNHSRVFPFLSFKGFFDQWDNFPLGQAKAVGVRRVHIFGVVNGVDPESGMPLKYRNNPGHRCARGHTAQILSAFLPYR